MTTEYLPPPSLASLECLQSPTAPVLGFNSLYSRQSACASMGVYASGGKTRFVQSSLVVQRLLKQGAFMPHRVLVLAIVLLGTSSVAIAQPKVTRCKQLLNEIICEEQEVLPKYYAGQQKWCAFLFRNPSMNLTAYCNYDKKKRCLESIFPRDAGTCIKNPSSEEEDE